MIGSRLAKNRKFSYEPRYYNPDKERREGHQIKFKQGMTKSAHKQRSIFYLIFLLGFVIYIIYYLSRLGK